MKSFFSFLLVGLIVLFSQSAYSQKVLNDSETRWVNEAKAELERALTDPDLSEPERMSIVQRSAQTLKEYGQPSEFPQDKIGLAKMMDENFNQCKTNISELNEWSLDLQRQTLDQKLKLINAIQIEVVEEEVKLLIPGKAPVELSQEAMGTIFDWNIVEGFNSGERNDANQLVEMFKQLARSKELANKVRQVVNDEKESIRNINADRIKVKMLEAKLRQKYKYAENSTRTMKGYEGAVPAGSGSQTESTVSTKTRTSSSSESAGGNSSHSSSVRKSNTLVGTWKFGFEKIGYFHWTFYNDGSFLFKDNMNDGDERRGKYSVGGNVLTLFNSEGCEKVIGKYTFRISNGEMRFLNIEDQCIERRLTLNHIWKK